MQTAIPSRHSSWSGKEQNTGSNPNYSPWASDPSASSSSQLSRSDSDREQQQQAEQPTTKKAKRGGKPKGAQTFNDADEERLFKIIEEVLPIGADMWDQVETRYNELSSIAGRKPRDSKYLKAHYRGLIKSKKPTGDPNRPPNVKKALELEVLIKKMPYRGT
ncbi:Similar to hypothetical protein PGTG_01009 [Puccinia graminis f. sp. tritici CRL 75-36-700-3]; acc. no. XP_003320097 [Pyronema omphalodes CBS 100304]|uniref:DUF6818 domain-containing protein n=1 Tax=Pyronema omphalodes (strain CBS 100304) TaxID=1076935 RepID=U4LPP0_PYROM|nr:Similar to hypothetical protein PGTG_01009 [Puccinia graminis f. sp. tritici CRL 75-36-700-3]; acc. no. XP_003320097 [Pyronema omphalodes CBS 100304]